MIRKCFSFLMLALLLTVQQAAANDYTEVLHLNESSIGGRPEAIPFCNHIIGTYLFEGDSDENFAGDYVTFLEDGSAWKIHPEDALAYSKWHIDDLVQPFARTSFYWFKREHKFMLHNYNCNQSLRAMLVRYPTTPLYIESVQRVAVGGHWKNTTVLDSNNERVKVAEWVVDYKKHLYLSDKSIWSIPDDGRFTAGRFILPGINIDGDRFWYYLALGLQKNSFYIKAERLY